MKKNYNRYVINRIGFVDFWLYKDQEFYFQNGKLLIRGANASGKSITTQSVIPFILDGDKRPERLDPFGSRDRKMEYYFLGLDDREEVTGYIYIEFFNESRNHYITIGIGQRAKRNSNMNFWGFILKDGRRIKEDFELYNKVGNKKIPLSKIELKNKLGPDNILVETQGEYESQINEHLFGFDSREEYKKLIDLLIKIRGSKLSRDFRPTDMYKLLNDSLQTLSDEDMNPLVYEMESLDKSIENIKDMEETIKEVKVISREYTKYNKYLLYFAAKEYKNAYIKFNHLKTEFNKKKSEVKRLEEEKENSEKILTVLQEKSDSLKKEQELLGIDDLSAKIEELDKSKKSKQVLEEKNIELERKIDDENKRLTQVLNTIKSVSYSKEVNEKDFEKIRAEIAEILGNEFLDEKEILKSIASTRSTDEIKSLQNKIKNYTKNIELALDVLKKLQSITEENNNISKEETELKKKLDLATINYNNSLSTLNDERDELIKSIYEFKDKSNHIKVDEFDLNAIKNIISNYSLNDRYDGILSILRPKIDRVIKDFSLKEFNIKNSIDNENEAISENNLEIDNLKNKKEMTYYTSEDHKESINLLKRENITFELFYKAIDFSMNIDEEKRNEIERLLKEFGLLDVIIVDKKDLKRAKDILVNHHYKIYSNKNNENNENKHSDIKLDAIKLPLISVSQNESINNQASELIRSIFINLINFNNNSDSSYTTFGNLDINILSKDLFEFIGENARLKAIERKISSLEDDSKLRKDKIELLKEELINLDEDLKSLRKEEMRIPKLEDLNASLQMEVEARENKNKISEKYFEIRSKLKEIESKQFKLQNELLSITRSIGLDRTVDRYAKAKENLEESIDKTYELVDKATTLKSEEEKISNSEIYRENIESNIDELHIKLRDNESEIRILNHTIESLDNFLNSDENKEKKLRLSTILRELAECYSNITTNKEKIVEARTWIKAHTDFIEMNNEEFYILEKDLDKSIQLFKEELDLKFIFDSNKINETSIDNLIEESLAFFKNSEKEISYQHIYDSLTTKLSQNATRLNSNYRMKQEVYIYSSKENRNRKIISLYFEGANLPLNIFEQKIIESKRIKEELIKEEDRKIFNEILTGTLGYKLTARIRESRNWISRISEMMENIDTSMKLTFSMDWKARNPEGEDELSTKELVDILNKSKELATNEDIEKVVAHFRKNIDIQKREAEINGNHLNYKEFIAQALDYRKWYEFRFYFKRADKPKKELTDKVFNTFSGGEKAMAMYIPFLTAISSQYEKARKKDAPRLIALDEAFAGVDDKNIESMFKLVNDLDYDYIFNSQALWGTFSTNENLAISELLRGENMNLVLVQNYLWNGNKKILRD